MRAANRKPTQPSSATRSSGAFSESAAPLPQAAVVLEATARAKQQSARANSPRCYAVDAVIRIRLDQRCEGSAPVAAVGRAATAPLRQKEQHWRQQAALGDCSSVQPQPRAPADAGLAALCGRLQRSDRQPRMRKGRRSARELRHPPDDETSRQLPTCSRCACLTPVGVTALS
jgi:hypothetical protein